MLQKFSEKIAIFFYKIKLGKDLIFKILVAYCLFLFIFGDKGIINLVVIYFEYEKLEQEVSRLKENKKELTELLEAQDPKSRLELEARQNLGLVYPNEKVILIAEN